ncbi:arf-GAP domain and FG repeat-containing protein 2 [Heteronotia binoei]|uniref:arf-GAP domain and FG repeat-containing protein 2 n=1 Tax=Heteronotia binoei TaxID=13085 RepID=UPI00292E5051|nr:arf-GAP domain and FG repeat-containing protein 2 [Heteronotia binoei]
MRGGRPPAHAQSRRAPEGRRLALMAAAGSGSRKPGSPRDSESEVWARRVRELVASEPANRLCFECGQRGVTYVDITIGSFVCTGCSGALRGLNPPHRVKSISMTTFTESEVQFLQSRGNQACQRIWLGSFDSRTSLLPDSQDPQKLKEFLQEKYEKKRWYVTPEQGKSLTSLATQSSTTEVKTLLGDSGPVATAVKAAQSVDKSQLQGPQPAKKASMDLLADIGGDPFAAPQSGPAFTAFPAFGGQVPAHATFTSFDAFGGNPAVSAFGDPLPSSPSPFQSQPIAAGGTHMGGFPASPASQPGVSIPEMGGAFRVGGVPSSVFGALSQSPLLPPPSPAAAYGACTNPFATSAISQPTLPSTNPFQTNGLAPGTFVVGSPGGFSASPLSGLFASPLQQQQQQFHPQALVGHQHNGGSPFGGFPITKVGQPVGISTNPFVTPMTTAPPVPFALGKQPPTNPFL